MKDGKRLYCDEICPLQEEPASEEQVKESFISIHDDKTCKEKSNSLTQEPTIPDIVDEHFHEMLEEESVSEDFPHIRHRDTLDEFAYQCAYDLSNDWAKETPTWHDVEMACKLGANWQKEKDESTTEDLCEYINELSKQFPEVSFAKLSRIAVRVAKWQKQQMIAKATEVTVHIDAGDYPYIPQIQLYDYDKDIPLAKEGDKYKVVLIKED